MTAFLALPELDDLIRFLVIAAFFVVPIVRNVLASLKKARREGGERARPLDPPKALRELEEERAAIERDEAAARVPDASGVPAFEGLGGSESYRSTTFADPLKRSGASEPYRSTTRMEPLARPEAHEPASVAAPSSVPRSLARSLTSLPESTAGLGEPALAPVPTEEALEEDSRVARRAPLDTRLTRQPAATVTTSPAGSRFVAEGWRRAVVLREVLGPPRAFEDLDMR